MSHEKLFVEKCRKLFPVMFQGRAPDDCWIWNGRVTWTTKLEDGRTINTVLRRIAYVAFKGQIPTYHEVKTACKHTGCVNPNHLTTTFSLRQFGKEIDDVTIPQNASTDSIAKGV